MPILPGAEDYTADGDRVAVLFLHGYTGNPVSMRPWAEHHAAAGLTVRLPRLPGHGTTWRDLAPTRWQDYYDHARERLVALRETGHRVVLAGLSNGGAIALRLAQEFPDVAGTVLVNPFLHLDAAQRLPLRLFHRIIPAVPAVGGDIAKPGADERAYPRTPLRALYSIVEAWPEIHRDLPAMRTPCSCSAAPSTT